MRELRLEAQRYRKAHVGPARDSWHALTRALGHLQLLALSPTELAARLPGRPTRASVAASIVEAHQRSTNDASSGECCKACGYLFLSTVKKAEV